MAVYFSQIAAYVLSLFIVIIPWIVHDLTHGEYDYTKVNV